uniref:Uncharacterized protein n=2 Tax=Oryza TaxID=4527 RepID=Q7XID6_ORYSJ|nr:hypothetical protein [Oryza sativa Japonica Group]BAD30359.1 hypothetical protein [Oryza sativa Japonica Group]
MNSNAESVHNPPEIIIHVVDDLAPPPPNAIAVPPRILPPATAFRRRPPPPSEAVRAARGILFIFKCKYGQMAYSILKNEVSCFAAIAMASSVTIYFMVHPIKGDSIADERSGVRLMCGFILAVAVIWLLLSYFSCDDKCVILDDEEQQAGNPVAETRGHVQWPGGQPFYVFT